MLSNKLKYNKIKYKNKIIQFSSIASQCFCPSNKIKKVISIEVSFITVNGKIIKPIGKPVKI